MSQAYFMGIDTGTTSSKGVIKDDTTMIIAVSSTQHKMANPQPGHYEHDAEQGWWKNLYKIGSYCSHHFPDIVAPSAPNLLF